MVVDTGAWLRGRQLLLSLRGCTPRTGDIGHIDDLLIRPPTWRIEHLLIDTSNRIGGRRVVIPAGRVEAVTWAERVIQVAMDRDAVANGPEPHIHR